MSDVIYDKTSFYSNIEIFKKKESKNYKTTGTTEGFRFEISFLFCASIALMQTWLRHEILSKTDITLEKSTIFTDTAAQYFRLQ